MISISSVRCGGRFIHVKLIRFHINQHHYRESNGTFPSLASSPDWFNIKLFPSGKDPFQPISYEAHRKAFTRAKAKAGIVSSKVTHLGRGSGAQAAELGGASEDNIRRAGRWEQGSMAKCYLSQLPRESMRVLAGFPADIGSFWISRDIEVPEVLLDMVFPETKEWYTRYTRSEAIQTICLGGFLRLLLHLRSVVIQDSILLRKEHPEHYLFQDKIFSTQAYHNYEVVFSAALVAQPSTIRMAMPAMEEKVTSGFSSLHTRVGFLDGKMDTLLKLNVASARIMHDVFDGKAPVKLQASWPSSKGSTSNSQAQALGPEHAHSIDMAEPDSAEVLVSTAALLPVLDETVERPLSANVEQHGYIETNS